MMTNGGGSESIIDLKGREKLRQGDAGQVKACGGGPEVEKGEGGGFLAR